MDGKAMQPTTSAINRLQPQHTHTIGNARPITLLNPHTMVHTHGWMVVQRLEDHTVMTNTPWFDGNHSLHQHHCGAQHSHPTHHSCHLISGALAIPMPLCAPPVTWKSMVLCMPCVATPLLSLLSTPFPLLTHSVCHWLSLRVKPSAVSTQTQLGISIHLAEMMVHIHNELFTSKEARGGGKRGCGSGGRHRTTARGGATQTTGEFVDEVQRCACEGT